MTIESSKAPRDMLKWATIVFLLTIACLGDYFYLGNAHSLRIIAWMIVLAVAFGLLMLTEQGVRLRVFSREARVELRKVVWPNRQETVQTTLLIGAMVIAVAVVLWGVDSVLVWLISKITV